jgi:hypothetical protein
MCILNLVISSELTHIINYTSMQTYSGSDMVLPTHTKKEKKPGEKPDSCGSPGSLLS